MVFLTPSLNLSLFSMHCLSFSHHTWLQTHQDAQSPHTCQTLCTNQATISVAQTQEHCWRHWLKALQKLRWTAFTFLPSPTIQATLHCRWQPRGSGMHADSSQSPSPPSRCPEVCSQRTHSMIFFFFYGPKGGWLVVCSAPDHPLLDLSEEECTICCLLVIRDLPWFPAPFKHSREGCCKDISQLSQHLCMQGGGSHGLVWDLILVHSWLVVLLPEPCL